MIETEEIKKHDLLKKIIYTYVHSHSLIIHPTTNHNEPLTADMQY